VNGLHNNSIPPFLIARPALSCLPQVPSPSTTFAPSCCRVDRVALGKTMRKPMKSRRKTSSAEKAALLRIFEGGGSLQIRPPPSKANAFRGMDAEEGNVYPSKEERQAIADLLRMSPRQVQVPPHHDLRCLNCVPQNTTSCSEPQVWFQNQRSKLAKSGNTAACDSIRRGRHANPRSSTSYASSSASPVAPWQQQETPSSSYSLLSSPFSSSPPLSPSSTSSSPAQRQPIIAPILSSAATVLSAPRSSSLSSSLSPPPPQPPPVFCAPPTTSTAPLPMPVVSKEQLERAAFVPYQTAKRAFEQGSAAGLSITVAPSLSSLLALQQHRQEDTGLGYATIEKPQQQGGGNADEVTIEDCATDDDGEEGEVANDQDGPRRSHLYTNEWHLSPPPPPPPATS
jgi:hypothetical protein